MSPERIKGMLDLKDMDSLQKADMWSVGILLYILISGHPPFEGKTNDDLYNSICVSEYTFAGKEWETMMEAKSLIASLLKYDSSERLTAYEAANHQFFNNIIFNDTP